VPGTVREFVILGDNASVAVAVDGIDETPLFMSIPLHAARRNRIAVGERVTVSLLANSIYIMPQNSGTEQANRFAMEAEKSPAEPVSGS
jgi:molybdate transport system ATP-binding protein